MLAFFLSTILSSFSFSPLTRLGLTTMLSNGPLTRLLNSKTNLQRNGGKNKLSYSLKALIIIHALK